MKKNINSHIDWIGEIPSDWSAVPVSKLFMISKSKIREGVLQSLSVGYMGVVPQVKNAAQNVANGDRKWVKKGDIVINSRSDRMGAAGLSSYEGGVSLVYHVMRPKSNNFVPNYYHYVYRNHMFSQEFYKCGQGIVADLWSTKDSDLKRILIPEPPQKTQQEIVEYLDAKTARVDALVVKKKKLIALLEEKRSSIITHAVTKGLDSHAQMKDSGVDWIGEMPSIWKLDKIKFYIKSHLGGAWGMEPLGDKNDLVCLRVADFDYSNLSLNLDKKTLRHFDESVWYKTLKSGDLLIEKSGGGEKTTVGRVVGYYLNDRCMYSNFTERIVLRRGINHKFLLFLFYAMHRLRVNTKHIKQTTGIQNLDINSYFNNSIPVPSVLIQNQIVEYLDAKTAQVDSAITKIEKQIALLQEYKQSLIYHVVTGKISV